MNRVSDLYQTACDFLEFDDMVKYTIVTQFFNFPYAKFITDDDAEIGLFQEILKRGKYEEFKSLIDRRKKHGNPFPH